MRKKNHPIILLLFITSILICCTSTPSLSKSGFMKNFRTFVAEVESEYKSFTDEDWEKKDVIFNRLSKVDFPKFKDQLTEDEIKEINNLIGQYNGLKFKAKSKEFIENVDEHIEEATEKVKGFLDALTSDDSTENK